MKIILRETSYFRHSTTFKQLSEITKSSLQKLSLPAVEWFQATIRKKSMEQTKEITKKSKGLKALICIS